MQLLNCACPVCDKRYHATDAPRDGHIDIRRCAPCAKHETDLAEQRRRAKIDAELYRYHRRPKP